MVMSRAVFLSWITVGECADQAPYAVLGSDDFQEHRWAGINDGNFTNDLPNEQLRSSSTQEVSMEKCFKSFCSSSFALNQIKDACNKRGGYKDCDKIAYHGTYFNEGSTYTYKWTNAKLVYDTSKRHDVNKPNTLLATGEANLAPSKGEGAIHISNGAGKDFSQTWSASTSFSFTDGVSTSLKVGFPDIADVSTEVSFSETWDISAGTTRETTTHQDISISFDLPADPGHCTTGCAIGDTKEVQIPYKITGHFTGSGAAYYGSTKLSSSVGAVCCYLRPGGSSDCPTMGHNKGGTGGWYLGPSPAYAQQYASSCPNLDRSGNDAVFTSKGQWSAGLELDVTASTKKGPYGKCPSGNDCLHSASSSTSTVV